jgi:hypothetical protein
MVVIFHPVLWLCCSILQCAGRDKVVAGGVQGQFIFLSTGVANAEMCALLVAMERASSEEGE